MLLILFFQISYISGRKSTKHFLISLNIFLNFSSICIDSLPGNLPNKLSTQQFPTSWQVACHLME